MKAKITEEGYLLVLRKNTYKAQYCPFHPENRCADYCPLFEEHAPDSTGYHSVILCSRQRYQVIDDRRK